MARIAEAEAEAGHIAAAKATLEGIDDDCVKAIAYWWIGGLQVKSGDLAGAKATAEQIRALASISRQKAVPSVEERHCACEALVAVLYCRIADAQDMAMARRSLALAQDAARQSVMGANAAGSHIKNHPNASWLHILSAAAQAMAGDARGAIRTIANGEENPVFRCQELSWIAEELSAPPDQQGIVLVYAGLW